MPESNMRELIITASSASESMTPESIISE
jgi:hypothetical protein